MATLTAAHTSNTGSLSKRFSSVFERLVKFAENNPKYMAGKAKVARLEALSDAELAAKGLTRDMIAYHVFRNFSAF